MDIECVRPAHRVAAAPGIYPARPTTVEATQLHPDIAPFIMPAPILHIAESETEQDSSHFSPEHSEETRPESMLPAHSTKPLERVSLGQLPTGKELEELVRLYFSSVHREC